MRCLLVEPLMLIFSLEDDEHKVSEGRGIMNISSACLISYKYLAEGFSRGEIQ